MINRILQRRLGNSEDLDGPPLLMSGSSAYINGSVIESDSGLLVTLFMAE